MRRKVSIIAAALVICAISFPSLAIIGIGVHWGNDFSLKMEDVSNEQLSFDFLNIDTVGIGGVKPAELTEITGKNLPLYLNCTDWIRKPINIGAKIYVDVIPVIDGLELSTNFGYWEYKGSLKYPVGISFKNNADFNTATSPDSLFDVIYDSLPLTLKEFDMDFLGIKNTPFMKLNFDLTIKKYLVQVPKRLKIFRLYGGGGVSLHFATPILNKKLIQDALGDALSGTKSVDSLSTNFANPELTKKILKKITSNLMIPHWGCHIALGAMLKLPVLPLGIYVDGKLMIPFDNVDENVDLGGFGLLVNSGISLTF